MLTWATKPRSDGWKVQMPISDSIAAALGISDRRPVQAGLAVTVLVHAAIIVMLATAGGNAALPPSAGIPGTESMCGDIRCAEPPYMSNRRGADSMDAMDAGIIEASIIPKLGLAKPVSGQLPRFLKYEQAEKIEESVNISKENQKPEQTAKKDVRPKKAQTDSRRKKTDLGDILGDAPDDEDPRARAVALDRIVGHAEGSTSGSGTEAREGSIYAAKVGEAIRAQFTVPPFLKPAQLKTLRVRIRITRIDAAGQILEFDVLSRSGEESFNNAALFAIRRFSRKDGGNVYLPSPDAKTLELVNRRGIVVDLDGSLFRK